MILRKGSRDEQVKVLQRYLGLKDDGVFGPNTENAVKAWQKSNGILDDGIVGPSTWNAMGLFTTDLVEQSIKPQSGILNNQK
jgi:peptidoglycan hydrolase-like protein with peptidoglycan-binding domain